MRAHLKCLWSDLLEFIRGALGRPGSFVAGKGTMTENLLVSLKAAGASTFVIQEPSRVARGTGMDPPGSRPAQMTL